MRGTYQLSPEELETLKTPHRLTARGDVSIDNVCSPSTLLCPHSDHIQDRSMGAEEAVDGAA